MAAPREGYGAGKDQDPLQQLTDELRAGKIPPLVFLYGKERFLVNRALDLLKGAALQPATRDFNYDTFEGKEGTAARVLSAAKTLPMMAKRRLVLVRDADELSADQLAAYIDYLAQPVAETCLCFVAEKADTRLRFFLQFKKHGLLLKLDPLTDRQLPGFARAEAQRLGVKLDVGAAERIAEEIGADLGQIADALVRLSFYVQAGAPIRVSDVEEVVATTRQHTVFELVDAVGAGDREAALRLLTGILAAREPALRLLAMLARHVRQLWVAREVVGRPAGEAAQVLGVPPFVASKLLDQARRLPPARIGAMHEAIYHTDRTLKLSKLDDARHMERLILQLCG